MDLKQVALQPADPGHYFADVAALMNTHETEPNTAATLTEWYHKQLEDGVRFTVAVSAQGKVLGFNGIYRDNLNIEQHYGIYMVVEQDLWGQGLGSLLYNDILSHAAVLGARTLKARVRDSCAEGIHFATRCGFVEKKHSIEMVLDLKIWEDQQDELILHALEGQGFSFTNMAEIGDTQEARRKLFALNNRAAATDPGSDGVPPWASFEEFDRDVCSSYWYHPAGQIIAIDTATGDWVAMSAITVFEGADHAYNLFTGTDVHYRGRKLAQAVKTLALGKALTFGVDKVRTSHNSENVVMIAIDTRLGYVRTPGVIVMEKSIL
jgi:mycothiol synthase